MGFDLSQINKRLLHQQWLLIFAGSTIYYPPAYKDGAKRLGCWFCHNQTIGELQKLRSEYPELWQELIRIDQDSPVTFKPRRVTVADLDTRLEREELK